MTFLYATVKNFFSRIFNFAKNIFRRHISNFDCYSEINGEGDWCNVSAKLCFAAYYVAISSS